MFKSVNYIHIFILLNERLLFRWLIFTATSSISRNFNFVPFEEFQMTTNDIHFATNFSGELSDTNISIFLPATKYIQYIILISEKLANNWLLLSSAIAIFHSKESVRIINCCPHSLLYICIRKYIYKSFKNRRMQEQPKLSQKIKNRFDCWIGDNQVF